MSIPPDLSQRLYKTLLRCAPFDGDQALAAVFVDERIGLWAADLPEASSKGERVRAILKYLADKRNTQGENALVLFLHVLYEPLALTDALHQELPTLAAELEQYAPKPDTPQWDAALDRYREWVKRTYGTMRVLGKHESVSLEGIYTDVNLLEQPAASRTIDLSALSERSKGERQDGLELVKQLDKQILVILGKPGAGKTTFLKHIALQAAAGQLDDYVPIFVALREWADDDDLLNILAEPFIACGLADPRAYVEYLLQTGHALPLFDALDEMGEKARIAFIKTLERFSRRYQDCHILLTCRTAATPYQFERAKTVEVADFAVDQMRAFAGNWFGEDTVKAEKLRRQIEQDKRLRDLGRTPLLLGMLCLTFDERGDFPKKRADLYRQALDTLLVQWDESRNIERDAMRRAEIYHNLSPGRKHQLFAIIAYETFEQGETLIPQERLERLIADYLVTIPNAPTRIDIDAGAVLKAIEAQHGILVEYTRRVYTFAHPTFQEYYTAYYIAEQNDKGDGQAISRLLTHVDGDRWREVILLTASLLPDADVLFHIFLSTLDNQVKDVPALVAFLAWATRKSISVTTPYKPCAVRAYYIWLARDYHHLNDLIFGPNRSLDRALDLARTIDSTLDHALAFERSFRLSSHPDIRIAFDRELTRELAGEIDVARDFAHECTRSRVRDLDHAIDCTLINVYDNIRACICSHDLDGVLVRSLRLDIGFACFLSRTLEYLLTCAPQIETTALTIALTALTFPKANASEETWQDFTKQLQEIMIEHRDIGHDWNFAEEQVRTLENYFTAAHLLVECLDVANISDADRTAIEDLLLLPPGYTEDA